MSQLPNSKFAEMLRRRKRKSYGQTWTNPINEIDPGVTTAMSLAPFQSFSDHVSANSIFYLSIKIGDQ